VITVGKREPPTELFEGLMADCDPGERSFRARTDSYANDVKSGEILRNRISWYDGDINSSESWRAFAGGDLSGATEDGLRKWIITHSTALAGPEKAYESEPQRGGYRATVASQRQCTRGGMSEAARDRDKRT